MDFIRISINGRKNVRFVLVCLSISRATRVKLKEEGEMNRISEFRDTDFPENFEPI